ncbi:MAG: aminotransferase class V-fold PLP-dependent enzyme [Clostridium sp.]|nr:aminotransferase class V-fold PLP-dependent enzyme [Clostridium sp.]
MIYFDNCSTSFPKAPGVGMAMMKFIEEGAVNVNRGTYKKAYDVENIVYETRVMLCKLFKFDKPSNVIFTPSITYSLNYFIKGFLKKGDHVIVSSLEHNAVIRPLTQMKDLGIEYSLVKGDMNGNIEAEGFREELRDNTKAIIVLHGSNVSGNILPIRQIGEMIKDTSIAFVVDTAQTAGVIDIDMRDNYIDFLAFTGHKGLMGPQGIGGFIVRDEIAKEIDPVITGGTGSSSDSAYVPQFLPDRFESGTLNIPGIVGLNVALKYLNKIGIEKIYEKELELTSYFIEKIRNIDGVKVVGEQKLENRVAVVSLDFNGLDNASVAFELDNVYNISTRVGLHCAPEAHKTLGTYPQGTVRFSFGYTNTKEEIDLCIEAIKKICEY